MTKSEPSTSRELMVIEKPLSCARKEYPMSLREKADAIQKLSLERSPYQMTAKSIAPDRILKASENRPFEDAAFGTIDVDNDIAKTAENFLHNAFHALGSFEVSFSINPDTREQKRELSHIQKAQKQLEECGHKGHSESLKRQYEECCGLREIFHEMNAKKYLNPTSVLSMRHLPDFLVTAPVWYMYSKRFISKEFILKHGKTWQFAWLWQIYNLNRRLMENFRGRDVMPHPLIQIMQKAQEVFDVTVIATPYHDVASREWLASAWTRNIDPYLLGFFRDLPFIFLLGRFSATGLFPLVCDMVADTIDHLKHNCEHLRNIPQNTPWIQGKFNGHFLQQEFSRNPNTVLIPFAQNVIEAFDNGCLFEFLRGETPDKNLKS